MHVNFFFGPVSNFAGTGDVKEADRVLEEDILSV